MNALFSVFWKDMKNKTGHLINVSHTVTKAWLSMTANIVDRVLKREFVGEISGSQLLFVIVEARFFQET